MQHAWGDDKYIRKFTVGTDIACEKVDGCRIGDEI